MMYAVFRHSDIITFLNSSYQLLKSKQGEINDLNVFPVPDGDTGTNMYLTMKTVMENIEQRSPHDLKSLADVLTHAALMGARGNSGVILSQIIRGFCLPWKDLEELTPKDFIICMEKATEISYKAVRKPVEGTMLTVIRETSESLRKLKKSKNLTFEKIFETAMLASEQSLKRTPELLQVLKDAGVVDAGGYGLVIMIKGAYSGFLGEEISLAAEELEKAELLAVTEEINFTYCTEILVGSSEIKKDKAETFLEKIGDSVLVVSDDIATRVHVHTDEPGKVLDHFKEFGPLIDVRINNMREQTKERSEKIKKLPQTVVTVSNGDGLKDIFKSLGASVVVNGGQTMNPSTEELLIAIDKAPSEKVILLTNNKNIVLAGEQAIATSKKEVILIPTRTIQQGIQAMLSYNPVIDFKANAENMKQAAEEVTSVSVTKAVRDSNVKGLSVTKGNYIGMLEDEIVVAEKDLIKAYENTIKKAITDEHSFATLFFGKDLGETKKDKIKKLSEKSFPHIDFEFKEGGQSHYHVLISIE